LQGVAKIFFKGGRVTIELLLAVITIIAPPILLSTFIGRSIFQQIKTIREALAFQKLVDDIISSNEETKKRLRVLFVEDENYTPALNMENLQTNNNLRYNFEHVDDPDELIREIMSQELGLVENPTDKQVKEILNNSKKRRKAKTIFFGEIVDNSYDDANIVDVEILEKQIRIKNN